MNLALFMLTFMLSGLYATESYSQTVRISLNMKNSTVKEVLKKIENCSEFTFFYNDEIIDVDKRVTLNAEDLSISDILTTILPNCSYTISNKNIIITVKEAFTSRERLSPELSAMLMANRLSERMFR